MTRYNRRDRDYEYYRVRRELARSLRNGGATLEVVGEILGVSTERARQIILRPPIRGHRRDRRADDRLLPIDVVMAARVPHINEVLAAIEALTT